MYEFGSNLFKGTLECYGTYRTKFESRVLDAYAGVRWWDMDIDVDVSTPLGSRSFSRYEDWVDPVIGVRWIPSVAEEWRLILQGDIGGFGVSSDFSWNVQAGALWDVSQLYSVVLMYRALAVDYNTGTRGTKDYFAYDTITHGPLLGVAFRF